MRPITLLICGLAVLLIANCAYFQPPIDRGDAEIAGDQGVVAYVLDGDIWIKRLPDGEPLRITYDGANAEPRWSPTGQWLAFRKLDSQVWLYSLTEKNAWAVENGAPANAYAWSPVGDRLAALIGSGILHMKIITPGSAETLTLEPPMIEGMPGAPFWNPTGEWIAYTWLAFPENGEARQTIRMRRADGGEPVTLLEGGSPATEPTLNIAGWLPQGAGLLFWYGPRLIDSFLPDTIDLRTLPVEQPQPPGDEPPITIEDVSWWFANDIATAPPNTDSGRGDMVAATQGAGPPWTDKAIAIPDRRLTPSDQAAIHPAWSPDGSRIAYSGMPDSAATEIEEGEAALSQRRIWITDTSGEANPQPATNDPAFRDERPEWSVDGRKILFARIDGEGQASLWLLSLATGETELVVERISLPNQTDPALQNVLWNGSYDWLP